MNFPKFSHTDTALGTHRSPQVQRGQQANTHLWIQRLWPERQKVPIDIFNLTATAPTLAVISGARKYHRSWLPTQVGLRTDPTVAQPLSNQALCSWHSTSTSRAATPPALTALCLLLSSPQPRLLKHLHWSSRSSWDPPSLHVPLPNPWQGTRTRPAQHRTRTVYSKYKQRR